jgi:phosphate ABC transporter phosphate-binding protein
MKSKYVIIGAVVLALIIVASVAAYTFLSNQAPTVIINGAGATFPYMLLNNLMTEYTNDIKPNVQVNYQSIGSGGGISALNSRTVDFGASDAPLTAAEAANITNALHIPETIGAVTVAYNIPGVSSGLKLTGQVIADIFQAKITKWNDAAIQNLNPGVTLPDQEITTVHRSDGSGTTFVFTSYLSKTSASWNQSVVACAHAAVHNPDVRRRPGPAGGAGA